MGTTDFVWTTSKRLLNLKLKLDLIEKTQQYLGLDRAGCVLGWVAGPVFLYLSVVLVSKCRSDGRSAGDGARERKSVEGLAGGCR